jgi:photosystem II stability/assembly factor-like uncharacterized protein
VTSPSSAVCSGLLRTHFRTAALAALTLVQQVPAQNEFWTHIGGPVGGQVVAVAFDSQRNWLFAAATVSAGYNASATSLFRSTDQGANWVRVNTPATFLLGASRALAIGNGSIYAAVDGASVLRSTDGGATWSQLNAGLPSLFVRDVAVSPAGSILCCPTGAGVYQFNSAQQSWSPVNAGLADLNTRAIACAPADSFWLAGTRTVGSAGVYKKIGAGSWAPAGAGLSNVLINALSIQPAAGAAPLRAYACTDAGLYLSTDQAQSWSAVPGPFQTTPVVSVGFAGESLIVGTPGAVYRSVAGGPWVQLDAEAGFTGLSGRSFGHDSAGNIYLATNETGVFRSGDAGQSWTAANTGLAAQSVLRMLVTSSGAILAGTLRDGIHRSADGGQTWDPPRLRGRNIFALSQSPWGDVFAGNYNITGGQPDGHAYRSIDDGHSWTPLDSGLNATMVSGFAFGAAGEVLCSSAWNPGGVSRSLNNGNVWQRVGPPQNIPAYFVGRSSGGDLYIGSEGHGVWRLPSGSNAWELKGFTQSQQFTVAFNSQGHVYFGNDGGQTTLRGVCRSTDGGQSFHELANFPSRFGYTIIVLPGDEIYVGTRDVGVQRSTDGGQTWQAINDGIPTQTCFSLALGPDGHLYAATAAHGIYRSRQRLVQPPPCAANCDESTAPPILNIDDFTCFVNRYAEAQNLPHLQQVTHFANCDASTVAPVLNVDDFTCFLNRFGVGCR